jgi:hypothetical protein
LMRFFIEKLNPKINDKGVVQDVFRYWKQESNSFRHVKEMGGLHEKHAGEVKDLHEELRKVEGSVQFVG